MRFIKGGGEKGIGGLKFTSILIEVESEVFYSFKKRTLASTLSSPFFRSYEYLERILLTKIHERRYLQFK